MEDVGSKEEIIGITGKRKETENMTTSRPLVLQVTEYSPTGSAK